MCKSMYKSIKKFLLADENEISDVRINSVARTIKIIPEGHNYLDAYEPISKYVMDNGDIKICGILFKIVDFGHFNTKVYHIELKALNEDELEEKRMYGC